MPLDHYVPQVHLRGFTDPEAGDQLHAYRKPGGEHFPCWPRDVCRDRDWSTNAYLSEPRIVETLLRDIEPRYAAAVENLAKGTQRAEDIFVIAGFTAFAATHTPTGMRLVREVTRGPLETAVRMLDASGDLPPPPPALGGRSISELLETGAVRFSIDGQYALALGVGQLHRLIDRLGNGHWTAFHVGPGVGALLTSDYPAACVLGTQPGSLQRFVPLRPDLGVLIQARRTAAPSPEEADPPPADFSGLKLVYRRAEPRQVAHWNRLIVQSAENLVFANHASAWLPGFVARHGGVWLETNRREVRVGRRAVQTFTVEARPRPAIGYARPARWD